MNCHEKPVFFMLFVSLQNENGKGECPQGKKD